MGTCSEKICKHGILFSPIQHLEWLRQGRPQGKQKCGLRYVKTAIFFTFVDNVKTNKHMFEFFSPSGSHTILVYRSYTDTNHRAASLRQQSFLFMLLYHWRGNKQVFLLHSRLSVRGHTTSPAMITKMVLFSTCLFKRLFHGIRWLSKISQQQLEVQTWNLAGV